MTGEDKVRVLPPPPLSAHQTSELVAPGRMGQSGEKKCLLEPSKRLTQQGTPHVGNRPWEAFAIHSIRNLSSSRTSRGHFYLPAAKVIITAQMGYFSCECGF